MAMSGDPSGTIEEVINIVEEDMRRVMPRSLGDRQVKSVEWQGHACCTEILVGTIFTRRSDIQKVVEKEGINRAQITKSVEELISDAIEIAARDARSEVKPADFDIALERITASKFCPWPFWLP
jgi:predicted transcriptional regulator